MGTQSTNQIRILALSDNAEVIAQLKRILSSDPGYQIECANSLGEADQKLTAPIDMVIVDDQLAGENVVHVVRQLATEAPQMPILAAVDQMAVSHIREILMAGARTFLTKPLQEAEVMNSLRQLAELETIRRSHAVATPNGSGHKCKVITIMSPKGGVGVTTIATNLAIALRKKTNSAVILLESQSSLGDLESVLNLHAQFNFGYIFRRHEAPDADLVRGALTQHTSGIQVLTSSRELEDNDLVTAELFETVIDHLREIADYIIIDGGPTAEHQTAATLAIADKVFLVSTPEIPALRRISLFLEAAERGGFPRQKLQLVINRSGEPGGVSPKEISAHLDMPIAAAVPDDPGLVVDCLNRGIPVVTADSRSAVARAIEKLVDLLVSTNQPQKREKSPGLVSRLSALLSIA